MQNSITIAIIAYLVGNFSSAYIFGKLFKGVDIRSYGSGNAGATNALRVFGKKVGIIALIFDVLKGVVAVYLGACILGEKGRLIAAVFVVLGHNWPVFLGFRGGKGIATSMGAIALLHWPTIFISIVLGMLIIIKTRYVSLGSIVAAGFTPMIGILLNRPFDKKFFLVTLILGIVAIAQHKDNLKRLIYGKEPKLGENKNT